MIKVGIGIPYMETWKGDFGISLVMATNAFYLTPFRDQDGNEIDAGLKLYAPEGSRLPDLRNEIVERAGADGCTHILWLDSDQKFPMRTIIDLLGHGKQMVGCNVPRKSIPSEPTCFGMDGKPLITRRASTGLVRVSKIGCGVLLMDMAVYNHVNRPFYAFAWDRAKSRSVGEDFRMCHLLAHRGVEMWCDQDLSKEIRHVGKWDYRHEQVPQYYEPDDAAGSDARTA